MRGVRAEIPIHRELLAALQRRPGVVGDHRHTAERLESVGRLERLNLLRLPDACDGTRGFVIVRTHLGAIDGRMLDGGVHHAVLLEIHAVNSLAADNVGDVVNRPLFAHVPPGTLRLEAHLAGLRHRQLRRRRNQRAVTNPPVAAAVNHFVEVRGAFRCRHAPLRGGGGDEHGASRCACVSERIKEIPDRFRSVGVLVAVLHVADGLLHLHARPIGVQLVGGNQRERGPDAGAHFGAMRDDEDGAVGLDAQVDAGVHRRGFSARPETCRALREQLHRRDAGHQHKRSGGKHPAQKVTPGDVFEGAHARPPCAAALIAARMR